MSDDERNKGVLKEFAARVAAASAQARNNLLYGVVDEVCPVLGGYFICFKPHFFMQADAAFLSQEVARSCRIRVVKLGDHMLYSAVSREGALGHYREIDHCQPMWYPQILPFTPR